MSTIELNPQSVTPQPVASQLTPSAMFLVVTNPGAESEAKVRELCADLVALPRAIGFRDPSARLSCVSGFGSEASQWRRDRGRWSARLQLF